MAGCRMLPALKAALRLEKGVVPLVASDGDAFTVFDGNRRVTCMKLLDDPRGALTQELQARI